MKRRTGQAGFSLIEVLVATALLTVIVMMIGMLFQQSGIAWRTGAKRAEGFTQIRSLIGALQRDASQAIDVEGAKEMRRRVMGGRAESAGSPMNQEFSGDSITFYTLSGTNRALTEVKYSGTTRTENTDVLSGSGSGHGIPLVPPDGKRIEGVSYRAQWGKNGYGETPGGGKGLPLYLTVEAKVTSSDYAADIGAASAGPDRTWGTKDDITTWSKK